MSSAIGFNLDQSKILLCGNGLMLVTETAEQVQSNLALHSLQTKSMVTCKQHKGEHVFSLNHFSTMCEDRGFH